VEVTGRHSQQIIENQATESDPTPPQADISAEQVVTIYNF